MIIYIKKEIMSGIRNHKFLILLAVYLFFALLDPIILKFLPVILADQFGGVDITTAMALNQVGAIQSYLGTSFQIVTLVIGISLMGLVASELMKKEIVIPACLGMSLKKWIVSKFIVYSLLILFASVLGQVICNIYSYTLFDGRTIGLLASVKSGILMGLFHTFVMSLIILFGTIFKKQGIAAFLSLVIALMLPSATGLLQISQYTPAGLVEEAGLLINYFTTDGIIALICSIGAIAIIIAFSTIVIESKELV